MNSVKNRVGDCSLFEQSTSHTTVRTVRYTAVQIPSCLICIVSFSVVPSSNTRHSCIPFAFHAISLQAVLSVFCFHCVGLLSPVTQDWYLFSPSRQKKNGTMTSADFSQQALLRISDFLLCVCETSPGKNDNFHSM